MVRTPSTMLPLGTPCPGFALPNVDGRTVSRDDFTGKPLLVAFICNHCPYVKHIAGGLVQLAKDYLPRGAAIVGVSSSDTAAYPDDTPERMRDEAARLGYGFPYLFDESQEVAKSFHAACTPDFFLFDAGRKLVYRGQFDASRPSNGLPVTGADVRQALDAVLAKQPVSEQQTASIGCNIKWKPGNEPEYFKT